MSRSSAAVDQARDLLLIRRIRSGDHSAKDEIVQKYLPMVKHIVRRHYASFLDREDLMQEGFIGLLAAVDEYRPDAFDVRFSSFAYLCIIRKVYNAIKQSNGNKHRALNDAVSLHGPVGRSETRSLLETLAVPEVGVEQDPIEAVEKKQVEQRIQQVLRAHLSVLEYTVAIYLIYGYTCGEIERAVGIKAKVVDNARTRIKAKIGKLLKEHGSLLHPGLPKRRRRRRDLYMQLPAGG